MFGDIWEMNLWKNSIVILISKVKLSKKALLMETLSYVL